MSKKTPIPNWASSFGSEKEYKKMGSSGIQEISGPPPHGLRVVSIAIRPEIRAGDVKRLKIQMKTKTDLWHHAKSPLKETLL